MRLARLEEQVRGRVDGRLVVVVEHGQIRRERVRFELARPHGLAAARHEVRRVEAVAERAARGRHGRRSQARVLRDDVGDRLSQRVGEVVGVVRLEVEAMTGVRRVLEERRLDREADGVGDDVLVARHLAQVGRVELRSDVVQVAAVGGRRVLEEVQERQLAVVVVVVVGGRQTVRDRNHEQLLARARDRGAGDRPAGAAGEVAVVLRILAELLVAGDVAPHVDERLGERRAARGRDRVQRGEEGVRVRGRRDDDVAAVAARVIAGQAELDARREADLVDGPDELRDRLLARAVAVVGDEAGVAPEIQLLQQPPQVVRRDSRS